MVKSVDMESVEQQLMIQSSQQLVYSYQKNKLFLGELKQNAEALLHVPLYAASGILLYTFKRWLAHP